MAMTDLADKLSWFCNPFQGILACHIDLGHPLRTHVVVQLEAVPKWEGAALSITIAFEWQGST